jgi:hypothetical protein
MVMFAGSDGDAAPRPLVNSPHDLSTEMLEIFGDRMTT